MQMLMIVSVTLKEKYNADMVYFTVFTKLCTIKMLHDMQFY